MSETAKQWSRIGTAGLAFALLAGCISTHTKPDPAYAATRPAAPVPTALNNGAIYQAGFAVSLFEDTKARHVGDILPIVLSESTNASKKASTATKKENAIELNDPTLFGSSVQFSMPGGTLGRAIPLATKSRNNLDVSVATQQDFTG